MFLQSKTTSIQFAAQKKYNKPTSFVFALILTLSLSIAAQAAPGDLDPSFGNGGKVITDVNNQRNETAKVAIQPDGKIVIGGNTGSPADFLLVRYNTNGSLDSTFGNGGIVITDNNGNYDYLNSVAIQADGKILAFGSTNGPGLPPIILLVRYNTDGTLDNSFGAGGKVTTSLGNFAQVGYSLVIQPDGKIVGVGVGNIVNQPSMFAARFNTNGTLDDSFGTGGKVIVYFGGTVGGASSVNLQPDGKIVLAGLTDDPVTFRDFAIARLNTDGSLDSSFGNGGKVTTNVDRSDGVYESVLQPDGKIVVVGFSNGGSKFAVVRYNTNGTLDGSFGNGGKVETIASTGENFGTCVTLQPDGKILVGGSSGIFPNRRFALVRYNTNGSIDTSFAANGIALTPIGNNSLDNPKSVLLQRDGKIVLAGDTTRIDSNETGYDFALVRYLNNTFARPAQFDFDGDGKADVSVFRPSNGAWYLLQSASGFTGMQFGISTDKLVPADFDGDGKTDIAVYRSGTWYLQRSSAGFLGTAFGDANDIPQPADFDGDGKAEIAVFRSSNGVWYIYNLANNQFTAFQFGAPTDKPVAGDYDGDGKTDIAVVRQAGGVSTWYILGTSRGFYGLQFGTDTDKLVPADYDGDGKTDVAVYRSGIWYVLGSTQGFYAVQFGIPSDVPVAADYDGDGKADIAVFRDGVWYLLRSQEGFGAVQFGFATDKPVQNTFVP